MEDDTSTAVSDEEILTVFAEREDFPLGPHDVADDLPITVEELRDRFDELTELDLLRRDDDRQSGTVWHLTDEGRDRADASGDEVVTNVEAQATVTGTQSRPYDQEATTSTTPEPGEETVDPPYEPPDDYVETFDPPGTPEQKEQRRDALRVAYGYLRDQGRASRSDFVDDVYPAAPGAYEDPADGWWEEVVRPGLDHLPGPRPAETGDGWRFDEGAAVRDVEE